MKRALTALALFGLLPAMAGCAAGPPPVAGPYEYKQNTLERLYEAPYEHVWEASVQAMHNLQFHSVDQRRDPNKGSVEARRADDKLVRVVVEKLGEKKTSVKVRVSDFESEDNRRGAALVHDRILANIK